MKNSTILLTDPFMIQLRPKNSPFGRRLCFKYMRSKLFFCLLAYLIGLVAHAEGLTNRVPITTNLLFALAGKDITVSRDEFLSDELLHWGIKCTSTNFTPFRTFSYNQSFDFHLFDDAGREVKKTKKGRDMSQTVRSPTSMSEAARLTGQLTDGYYALFRTQDIFEMPTNGTYVLRIQLRLWAQTTNQTPDYEIMTHFMKSVGTNIHYGLVVSQPVRVKIIKQ